MEETHEKPHTPDRRQRMLAYGRTYPNDRAGRFYALNYIRKLFALNVAQKVEPAGMMLLALIASLEDETSYTDAVLFTDAQLWPTLGINKKTLIRVRRLCVDSGWLHFERGWPGVPSRYWTETPLSAGANPNRSWWRIDTNNGTGKGVEIDTNTGTHQGTGEGSTFSSYPNPKTAPHPLTQEEGERVSGREIEIGQLAKELSELGVAVAMQAASTALSRRMIETREPIPLELVRQHVAYFREHENAYDPVVLYHRMIDPNLVVHPPADRWPPTTSHYLNWRNSWSRLEKKFGPLVDGLSEQEMREQVGDIEIAVNRLSFSLRKPPLRYLCLVAIDNRVTNAELETRRAQITAEATTQPQLPKINWKELERDYGAKVDQLNDIELRALVSRVGSQFGLRTDTLEISRRQDFSTMFRRELLQAMKIDSATN